MSLTDAALVYYIIAIPACILMCKMLWVSGRDEECPEPPTYGDLPNDYRYPPQMYTGIGRGEWSEEINRAHRKLTIEMAHTMDDVGIDGTADDLKRMLTSNKD